MVVIEAATRTTRGDRPIGRPGAKRRPSSIVPIALPCLWPKHPQTPEKSTAKIPRGARHWSFMRSAIWIGIFIGSTIGSLMPGLWGAGVFSYSSVLLGGAGALVGLWIGFRISI
jgi:hypothetical protein